MTRSQLTQMTDEKLCERVGADPKAEDYLFLRHIEPVTRFLTQHFQGIEHEAVAAEVLADALSYVGRHGLKKSFRALLRHVALQYGWKARRRSQALCQKTTAWGADLEVSIAAGDFAARVQDEAVLAQALQCLTDWERLSLLLRYVDGLSEAEIAQQTGKTRGAVKSALYHARCKLRADKTLAELYHQERKLSMQGWFLTGSTPQHYETGVTREVTRTGRPSASLKSKSDEIVGFGTLMQSFLPDHYLAKRVRFSAYVKAEAVTAKAGLWMRVDGPVPNKHLSFDNMDDRPIQGTLDWHLYSVVLDVPAESTKINFGVLLTGPGQVWLTELQFEEVSPDVPVTSTQEGPPKEPQNLNFEVE